MRPGRVFGAVAAVLVFALAVELSLTLERTAPRLRPAHSLYVPHGRYLGAASLGFRHLIADMLYVWSIQYYSTTREDRWRYLDRLYDAITDLDRRFVVAYSVGALILALEAKNADAALRLLDKGIARNPETFFLAWDAGFHARAIGEHARASEYFRIAHTKPDAPSFVARWYYRTREQAGDTEGALALWREAEASARNDRERAVAERYVHDLTLELALRDLRAAVARFHARQGRFPFALEELVRTGDLAEVPLDPDGEPFVYERSTGEVRSRGGFLLYYRSRR